MNDISPSVTCMCMYNWFLFLSKGVTAIRDVDFRSCYITSFDPEWSLDQDSKIAIMEAVV